MRVLIIGINHQIQPSDILSWSSSGALERFERGQKDAFAELVQAKIKEGGVQYVVEESKHGQQSVVESCCRCMDIRYENIEMPEAQRAALQISPGYAEDKGIPPDKKAKFHAIREQHMVEAMLAGAQGADSVILICGREHSQALADRLIRADHTVEISDLSDQSWYVEDWQSHMLRL